MSIALLKLDEDVISSSDREYQALLRSLRRRKGFGLIFLRCTPVGGLALIEKFAKISRKKSRHFGTAKTNFQLN
ncbi:MAG: hypothetical protein HC856_10760 [Pseudanabaena sp. RU_4_16]|nr:hypothetical protein [Pseudanabaena sp. RU_4_16]